MLKVSHNFFFEQLPLSSRKEINEAKNKLKAIVEPMVEEYSKKIGVVPLTIKYCKISSRFGICDIKSRSISFSVYVLLLPYWCKEYIVVHELCTLMEPSNNVHINFLMDKYLPQWREIRKEIIRISKIPIS